MMAAVGQTETHAPQSIHSAGFTKSWGASSKSPSAFWGWMESEGQASTHNSSLVQASVITWAIGIPDAIARPQSKQKKRRDKPLQAVVRVGHCAHSATRRWGLHPQTLQ